MQNHRVFNAESGRGLMFHRLYTKFIIPALAEENPDPNTDPEDKGLNVNFEQMIAQARKEEKDKLYPRLQKAEAENKTLTASVNKYLLENAALKEELEKRNGADDPEKKALETKVSELEAENKRLKESTPDEASIREKVKAEYEVKLYAQKAIDENKDDILSFLVSDIKGSTKEEVDAAVQSAKDKTLSVKKDLGLVDEEGNPITTKKETAKKKPAEKQKKAPPANPAETPEEDEFDAEYIRNLDPRSEEYAAFRKKMGLR